MTEYRKPASGEVAWAATKYDGLIIRTTAHPYKKQGGSARSVMFPLIKDGDTIGQWTKKCAKNGYEANFAVGSLTKYLGATECAFKLEAGKDGKTLDAIKGERQPRVLSPEAQAKKDAKAKEAADKKAARDKAKADKEAQKQAKIDAKKAAGAKEAKGQAAAAAPAAAPPAPAKKGKKGK